MRTDRILVVCIALVLAAAAVIGGVKWFGRSTERPSDVPQRRTLSLLVVGVEGLDFPIVERMSAEGRLPNITRLMREGATGEFASLGRGVDARISWTSMVTGVAPENQGIGGGRLSHRGEMVAAPLVPESRTVGTVWTAVGDAGSTVGVLGWPGTWPVEEVKGVMVGPYVHYYLERTHGGDPRNAVYPFEQHPLLDPLILGDGTHTRKDLSRFVDVETRLGLEALIGKGYDDLDIAVAGDASMVAVARRIASDPGVENILVFLNGVEIVSQRFWHYMHPDELRWEDLSGETRGLVEGQVEALGGTIERYYEFVDALLGRLEGLVREDGTIALVSDHGYSGLTYNDLGHPKIGPHMHSEVGFWVIRGPHVTPGARAQKGSLLDTAPTIMAAASVAPPNEFDGAVREEALNR